VLEVRRLHHEGLRLRVDLALGRREHHVHAHVFHHFSIGLQGARVALEILFRPELDPVDEYADDGARRAMLRQPHQLDVARVQIAHGRDEDVVRLALQPLAQIPHRSEDVHRGLEACFFGGKAAVSDGAHVTFGASGMRRLLS